MTVAYDRSGLITLIPDRLDLGRVGIYPSPFYLSQEESIFIDLANDLSMKPGEISNL